MGIAASHCERSAATCHCERSAAIRSSGIVAVTLLLAIVSTATAKYSGGSGTAQDPYQIATAADLIALGETPADYDKHFVLTADIDLDPKLPGRKVFDKAVIAPDMDQTQDGFQGTAFTGVFDGKGHTISHLTITGKDYLGLFGELGSRAEVKDLGLVDVNITGSGDYVGGLVGRNGDHLFARDATITNCYSTGAVSGNRYVGGLVGSNSTWQSRGSVTNCYSTTAVRGTSSVGGLVGYNGGSVNHCYSTGAVTGSGAVGGLVGNNDEAYVTQCYSTGAVSGTSDVGGLVGSNSRWQGGGSVTNCYSTGSVSGTGSNVAGLVGHNYCGSVTQCYSTSAVSGTSNVGGLVGHNHAHQGVPGYGYVGECYSAGAVTGKGNSVGGLLGSNDGGIVTACFWDIQKSGQTTSAGGTGTTTGEMQTAKTFLDAGWDFVNETKNGAEDIWWILDGKDYPRLSWEHRLPWALSPDPQHGVVDVSQPVKLRWVPGGPDLWHDIYFGDNEQAVVTATTESPGIYRGRQPAGVTTYDLGILERAKTYYWRIDEVNDGDPNSSWKGSVWSFRTSDYIVSAVLDDFESYTDKEGGRIYQTWKDGSYEDANSPGNGTGSIVGNNSAPFAEQKIVHGGKQAMPMDYNNVKKPWYSEADRTCATPQNWTVNGADTLTLYFRGKADNGPDRLYVGIEDSAGRIAVVVHPEAGAVRATEWQKWHIALGEVRAAGVNVAAVKKMVIGVGDRKNPKPGGTGRSYIDDIRLTTRMP